MLVRAAHVTEIRTRIAEWRAATGRGSTPDFTAGPIVAGTRTIKASDYNDLRAWLEQPIPPPPPSAQCQAYAPPGGGAPSTLASYFYDAGGAAANALGRRTRMTDPSGATTWSYDRAGRVTQQQTILGATVTTQALPNHTRCALAGYCR